MTLRIDLENGDHFEIVRAPEKDEWWYEAYRIRYFKFGNRGYKPYKTFKVGKSWSEHSKIHSINSAARRFHYKHIREPQIREENRRRREERERQRQRERQGLLTAR